jgi:hypothetical protein
MNAGLQKFNKPLTPLDDLDAIPTDFSAKYANLTASRLTKIVCGECCGAGVPPAFLPPETHRKTAGRMPAPQKRAQRIGDFDGCFPD